MHFKSNTFVLLKILSFIYLRINCVIYGVIYGRFKSKIEKVPRDIRRAYEGQSKIIESCQISQKL